MRIAAVRGIFLVLLFALPAYGQDLKPEDLKLRVFLEVSGDTMSDPVVLSELNKALRKLANVQLVENEPDFVLSVIVIEPTLGSGKARPGTILSCFIAQRYDSYALFKRLPFLDKDERETVATEIRSLYYLPMTYVRADATENIPVMSREFISIFDNKYVEPFRKNVEEYFEKQRLRKNQK